MHSDPMLLPLTSDDILQVVTEDTSDTKVTQALSAN